MPKWVFAVINASERRAEACAHVKRHGRPEGIPGRAYSMSRSDPDDSTAANRQTWQRFSEAWAKRDIDGLMALVTDDIFYGASVGPEPGATFRGRDAVRR